MCSFLVSLPRRIVLNDPLISAVGYSNTMEGLSGGFVYGAGGSGLITPHLGISPLPSGFNTPAHHKANTDLTQQKIDVAFDTSSA